jgi:hypothetical protein
MYNSFESCGYITQDMFKLGEREGALTGVNYMVNMV